jgi:hypothetical protein
MMNARPEKAREGEKGRERERERERERVLGMEISVLE